MRLFLAIELNPKIRSMLANIQALLKENILSAKIIPSEMMHITLVYFGEKSATEYEEIDEIVSMITLDNFKIELGQLDFFTKKKAHVCYCSIKENEDLKILHKRLKDSLLEHELSFDARTFKPHITLARNVQLKHSQPIILPYVSKTTFEVNSIVLYQSLEVKGQLTYMPLIRYDIKKDAD